MQKIILYIVRKLICFLSFPFPFYFHIRFFHSNSDYILYFDFNLFVLIFISIYINKFQCIILLQYICEFLREKIILVFKSMRFDVCIGDESFAILVRNNLQYKCFFLYTEIKYSILQQTTNSRRRNV